MSDDTGTFVFLFKYETPDGKVQSVISVTHYATEPTGEFLESEFNHPHIGKVCNDLQYDAVNKKTVYKQFPGNEAYAEKEWQAWVKLATDNTGAIPDHDLAGAYWSLKLRSTCAVPTVDDFKPTLPGDGPAPAVPLSTASVETPDPTPAPLPAPAPSYTATALVAASPAIPELAMTGGNPGPLAAAGGGLLALGVILAWCSRRLSSRHS